MDRLKELIKKAEVLITKKGKKKKEKNSMNSANIDKATVTKALMKKAKQAFGDDFDQGKFDKMVTKAISMSKDTEDAIGIGLGFFQAK